MKIEIENLTKAQELAIETMLSVWQTLGGVGSSRYVCFYADGDGNFRPKILVDGNKPQKYVFKSGAVLGEKEIDGEILIDPDGVAWDLRGDQR